MKTANYFLKIAVMAFCLNLTITPEAQTMMRERFQTHDTIVTRKRRTNYCMAISGALYAIACYFSPSYPSTPVERTPEMNRLNDKVVEHRTQLQELEQAWRDNCQTTDNLPIPSKLSVKILQKAAPAVKSLETYKRSRKSNATSTRFLTNTELYDLFDCDFNKQAGPYCQLSVEEITGGKTLTDWQACNNWWLQPYCTETTQQVALSREQYEQARREYDKYWDQWRTAFFNEQGERWNTFNREQSLNTSVRTGTFVVTVVAALYRYVLSRKYKENLGEIRAAILANNGLLGQLNKPQLELLFKFAIQEKDFDMCRVIYPCIATDYNFLLKMHTHAEKVNYHPAKQVLAEEIHRRIQKMLDQDLLASGTDLPPGIPALIADYVERPEPEPQQESKRQASEQHEHED